METNKQEQTNEQKKLTWLDEELANTQQQANFEELPSMKFVEKKITEIEIDFCKPFDSWNGEQSGKQVTKKIIPIIHNGERKNWWMNVRNPVYHEIIEKGIAGQTKFKILQTGTQASTRYSIVE